MTYGTLDQVRRPSQTHSSMATIPAFVAVITSIDVFVQNGNDAGRSVASRQSSVVRGRLAVLKTDDRKLTTLFSTLTSRIPIPAG